MINGLQIVTHAPMFDLKTPGNMNTFNKEFIEIANLEAVDTTELT